MTDNRAGGAMAAEHLLAQGHRRIAALSDLSTIYTANERITGFRSAYTARGLRPDPDLVIDGLRSHDQASEVVHELLAMANPPTAIFTARNILSTGVVRALAERGLRREVALVGFDDFPLADLLDPPLTVIRQDVARIGKTVAELLFARIDGDDTPPRHVVTEPTLVVRGSARSPRPRADARTVGRRRGQRRRWRARVTR